MALTYCGSIYDRFFRHADPDWEVDYSGDVNAPTGHFAIFEVTEEMISETVTNYGELIGDGPNPDLGWYLVTEDDRGFTFVHTGTEAEVRQTFADLGKAYVAGEDEEGE
jgi:hypothetical protein